MVLLLVTEEGTVLVDWSSIEPLSCWFSLFPLCHHLVGAVWEPLCGSPFLGSLCLRWCQSHAHVSPSLENQERFPARSAREVCD